MSVSSKYNRTRFAVNRYEFQSGGDGDCVLCDFVGDNKQGFGVPAKSLMLHNHGGGAGDNFLYYRTIHTRIGSAPPSTLEADAFINYQLGETIFYAVLVWASNANLVFSLDATPGEWTDADVDEFTRNPFRKKTIESVNRLKLLEGVNVASLEI